VYRSFIECVYPLSSRSMRLIKSSQPSTGARIALGSDMPVESPDPLVTFHAAVTRVNATGDSPQGPGGWYPEQKLTREQALKGTLLLDF
jgi:predicted amidohydrolase YtcJ